MTKPTTTLDAVRRSLRSSKFTEEDVVEFATLLDRLSIGRLPKKYFPKGIPVVDGLVVDALLDPDDLGDLIDLIRTEPRIDVVEIFPRGIVNPERFAARIGLR